MSNPTIKGGQPFGLQSLKGQGGNFNKFEIMVVDDNRADLFLIDETIQSEFSDHVRVVLYSDSLQALEELLERYEEGERLPGLILLDLNMPDFNGFEFLSAIKNHENLISIPVIVFTSSSSPDDLKKTQKLHANAYVIKPNDIIVLFDILRHIYNFWFKTAHKTKEARGKNE